MATSRPSARTQALSTPEAVTAQQAMLCAMTGDLEGLEATLVPGFPVKSLRHVLGALTKQGSAADVQRILPRVLALVPAADHPHLIEPSLSAALLTNDVALLTVLLDQVPRLPATQVREAILVGISLKMDACLRRLSEACDFFKVALHYAMAGPSDWGVFDGFDPYLTPAQRALLMEHIPPTAPVPKLRWSAAQDTSQALSEVLEAGMTAQAPPQVRRRM